MSHFAVLVVGSNPDDQLAPFQENNMEDCPRDYLVFCDEEDKYLKEYLEDSTEKVVMPNGRLLNPWDDKFRKPGTFGLGSDTHEVPADLEKKSVPFKELYPTFEEYMKDWCGYDGRDAEKNRYGHWENPNAKWDWYQIGGRWSGYFKLKNGCKGELGEKGLMGSCSHTGSGYADQLIKKDIDIGAMRDEAEKLAREDYSSVAYLFGGSIPRIKTWDSIREAHKGDIEAAREEYHSQPAVATFEKTNKGPFSSLEDYPESEDIYAKRARDRALTTFAVLMNGKWYERGSMGWWGLVGDEKDDWDEKFAELFDSLPEDTLLTVVDCHI